jgi:ABC-type glycerol-3-phosphate transport system permease component
MTTIETRRRHDPGAWRLSTVILSIAMAAFVLITTIYPIAFVFMTALKTPADYTNDPLGLPLKPTTEYLQRAFVDGHVAENALHSLLAVVPGVAIVAVASALAGFALACIPFRGRTLLLIVIIGLMAMPLSVVMVPIFRIILDVGLHDSFAGLALVYGALYLPLSVYLMTSFMRGLPREILEAAYCDGASWWRAFRSVALPLARPAVATVVALNFVWLWNELLFGLLILQRPDNRTLMSGLAVLRGEVSTSIPLLCASLALSLIPAVGVFLVTQGSITRGVTAGAVK